ncbi:MAG: GNAT family N-acetyltransferase [Acidobacteriota bacterium]|nr:GNAT family N-acetyltransferase [Acidobacteriota bacterium]
MIGCEVEEITTIDGLEKLAPEWRSLYRRCPNATPFQSPEWLLPWLRHMFRGGEIWALVYRHENRLAALASLFIRRHWRDFETRQISFIGTGISDYLDVLADPDSAPLGISSILAHIAENRSRWDICHLQELRPSSPLLAADFPAGVSKRVMPAGICPVLRLPESMALVTERLPHKFRTDLRRAGNRLRTSGDFIFETATSENLSEYLEALFRLHSARWELRDEPGVLRSVDIREFHREAAQGLFDAGQLRVHGLRRENEIVAVVYSFLNNDRAYAYLGGFDPAISRLSPGSVLIEFAIKSAVEEGVREYDFLREKEEYKHLWGAVDCQSQRLICWHSSSRLPSPGFPEEETYEC